MAQSYLPKEYATKLKSTIKKTNTRIQRIATEFGTDSPVYKNQIKTLQRNFGNWNFTGANDVRQSLIYTNNKGVLQIREGAAKYGFRNTTSARQFGYAMGKVNTVQGTYEKYAEKLGVDPDEIDLRDEQIKKRMNKIANDLDKLYDNFKKAMDQFYEGDLQAEIDEEIQEKIDNINKILTREGSASRLLTEDELQQVIDLINEANTKYRELQDKRLKGVR